MKYKDMGTHVNSYNNKLLPKIPHGTFQIQNINHSCVNN